MLAAIFDATAIPQPLELAQTPERRRTASLTDAIAEAACGDAFGAIILPARSHDDTVGNGRMDAMDEKTVSVNDDFSVIYNEASDEELEAAAAGLLGSWGTAGGWMSSTPQCCSPYAL